MENFQNVGTIDYSFVNSPAKIAVYNDLRSAPKVITINPDSTLEFIENLTSKIYTESQNLGGKFAYTIIKEITENFIHANFTEVVVSILDDGNTIRFTDQGPGFSNTECAILPGFSSASEPMKQYIRGVGSGLPIVYDYTKFYDGSIKIENNLDHGSCVTVTMLKDITKSCAFSSHDISVNKDIKAKELENIKNITNTRQITILKQFLKHKVLGITELTNLTGYSQSTVYNDLMFFEENKILRVIANKKRVLTELGIEFLKLFN